QTPELKLPAYAVPVTSPVPVAGEESTPMWILNALYCADADPWFPISNSAHHGRLVADVAIAPYVSPASVVPPRVSASASACGDRVQIREVDELGSDDRDPGSHAASLVDGAGRGGGFAEPCGRSEPERLNLRRPEPERELGERCRAGRE